MHMTFHLGKRRALGQMDLIIHAVCEGRLRIDAVADHEVEVVDVEIDGLEFNLTRLLLHIH
jgi:hypothetical protein